MYDNWEENLIRGLQSRSYCCYVYSQQANVQIMLEHGMEYLDTGFTMVPKLS